jgi:hypothetical protein
MDNPVINEYGDKRWYDTQRRLHRADGPAAIYADGTKSWYQHDKRHRDDGPAVEHPSGDKSWYQYGVRHRDDGPAMELACGSKYWYLNNRSISFDEWLDRSDMSDEDKVMMKLKYG